MCCVQGKLKMDTLISREVNAFEIVIIYIIYINMYKILFCAFIYYANSMTNIINNII